MASLPKNISKSKLSLFLRTKCDLELFLSLHTPTVLASNGLPEPLRARPGIAELTRAGIEFEEQRNQQIRQAFGASVFQNGHAGVTTDDLGQLLSLVSIVPSFILQPRIRPTSFRQQFLANLGLTTAEQAIIPPLEAMIPDVIIVSAASADDEEVLPNGERNPIAGNESRFGLVVVDIKHAAEANASYSAEVALYTYALANFLRHTALDSHFYVSAAPVLWTRSSLRNSRFSAALSAVPPVSVNQRFAAMLSDCDAIPFRFYMQTIRRFFREDLPRVISIGDTNWQSLEWHVSARCASCDWLAHRPWLSPADQAKVTANPTHYCGPRAEQTDDVCRIPGITKGAKTTLGMHALTTTAGVSGTTGSEAAYRQHTVLKKDRFRIPVRAASLQSSQISVDGHLRSASLAREASLQLNVIVNFDSSADLLTGLAIAGRLNFGFRQPPIPSVGLGTHSYVVDGKSFQQEWIALQAFLLQLESLIASAEQRFGQNQIPTTELTTQVVFWEQRQFQELCNALGRHLPSVFSLTQSRVRALAWLFPPDELLERDDGAVSPCIGFLKPLVERLVSTPVPHALTLFDVAERYHFGSTPPSIPSSYYREHLNEGIPRERIYELWSGADPVSRGSQIIPRPNLLAEYIRALSQQAQALASVALRVRVDMGSRLIGRAARLPLSVPRGPNRVSFDGKLWAWWDALEFATNSQASIIRMAEDETALEANYEAIKLIQQTMALGSNEYVYTVSSDSIDTKLDDGTSFLAIGSSALPGLPLRKLITHVNNGAPPYPGRPGLQYRPLYSALRATLVSFNRSQLTAVVRFDCDPPLINYIQAHTNIDLQHDIYLVEGKAFYDPSTVTKGILEEIGNPPIAIADPAASAVMQQVPSPPGADPVTPAARVLWDAGVLSTTAVIPNSQTSAIVSHAQHLYGLNASQIASISRSAQNGLTVIWGPPGTGKTQTLVALVHALIRESIQSVSCLRIFISALTYKAVETLALRLLQELYNDTGASCSFFLGYSSSRQPVQLPPVPGHLSAESFRIGVDQQWHDLIAELANPTGPVVFGTSVFQAHKVAEAFHGTRTGECFDVVILDESSQIPVCRSLGALGLLTEHSRLIVAGDHLQMPPIEALEPPVGAEHLVGSIQTYLLQRQFNQPVMPANLLVNYRSGAELVEYARTIGYPPNLTSAYPGTRLHLLTPVQSIQSQLPSSLLWSQSWGDVFDPQKSALTLLHDDATSSQSNEYEAKIVASLLYLARHCCSFEVDGQHQVQHRLPTPGEFWSRCVGIVTPHRAQRAAIIRELRTVFPADSIDDISSAVDTVEKFQGGERNLVMVSFGVGDPDVISGEEAFLMQLERTNVAISRARAKCIVMMPRSLAGHVPEDRKALDTAHALKGYIDEFCNIAVPITIGIGPTQRVGQLRWHQ